MNKIYQAEVVETVLRHRIYFVEAEDEQKALERLNAGETLEEIARGDDFKDEVIGRNSGPPIEIPEVDPDFRPSLTMPSYAWPMLRVQKLALMEAMASGGIDKQAAEGLLGLIDTLQDQAVDTGQVPPHLVGFSRTTP